MADITNPRVNPEAEAFEFPDADPEKHRSFGLYYDRPLNQQDTVIDELANKHLNNFYNELNDVGIFDAPKVTRDVSGAAVSALGREVVKNKGDVGDKDKYSGRVNPKSEYERDELARLAHTDSRSGLPNVHAFEAATNLLDTHDDGVENREAKDGREIITLDINGFKRLNDTYGHALGHKILGEVGSHLVGTIKDIMISDKEEGYEYEGSNAFRTGGDEFSILSSPDDIQTIEERVVCEFGKGKEGVLTTTKRGETLVLEMSNGSVVLDNGQEVGYIQYSGKYGDVRISLAAGHGENTEDADFAMYEMKQLVKRKEEELANN